MGRALALGLWFLAAAIIACMLSASAGSTEHIVGGNKGWKVPKRSSFYDDWSKARKFVVGDKLVFSYKRSAENVIEVPAEDFEACTQEKVINMYFQAPTILTLTKPGPHYYYSGIGTHCEAGQKLRVDVADDAPQ